MELMEYAQGMGTLSASTYGGVRGDALRSLLQKAIRLGDEEWALRAAAMLYALGTNGEHPKEAQQFRTNLLNRLWVIMVEDVGIAQPDLPAKALPLFKEARAAPAGDSCALANLVCWLCRSRKIRLLSDWGVMWKAHKVERIRSDPEWAPLYFSRYEKTVAELLEECGARGGELAERNARTIRWMRGKSEEWIRRFLKQVICLLSLGDHLALYYAMVYLIQTIWRLRVAVNGRRKPVYLLFAVLRRFIAESGSPRGAVWRAQVQALEDLYRVNPGHGESHLLVLDAMLYCLDMGKLRDGPPLPEVDRSLRLPESPQADKLPDYAYDKHTVEGKGKGKNSRDFAFVGARVANEAEHLVDPQLRKLYHRMAISEVGTKRVKRHPWTLKAASKWAVYGRLKALWECAEAEERPKKRQKVVVAAEPKAVPVSPEPVRESKAMQPWRTIRVQVLTSKSKPDVYLVCDDNSGRFVKGPYASEEHLSFQLALNNEWKPRYAGIEPIPGMRVEWWLPDLWTDNPPGFGMRTKVERGKVYPFLVMEDVGYRKHLGGHKIGWHSGVYPVRYGKEGKCWSSRTYLAGPGPGTILRHLDIGLIAPPDYEKLMAVLLFRHIWWVTDTCERNILVRRDRPECGGDPVVTIFSVDEESSSFPTDRAPTLFKKPLTGERREAMEWIVKETEWERFRSEYLLKWREVPNQPAHVLARLDALLEDPEEAVKGLI